jgi:hypothetical protein
MTKAFLAATILTLTACASAPAAKKLPAASVKQWTDGIIVARNFCRHDRTVQYDPEQQEGQRAYCAFEEPTGSNISSCVCRHEMTAAQDRDQAQQFMRDAEQQKQNIRGQ